ncbi:MAG: hypothetical protein HY960_10600 [Ignavibacteriae bacterium]|nr:hypothetical protein [Ignavibacteriota bacterium]
MSIPIKNKFAISSADEVVTFELQFNTHLLCVYDADLRLQGTNNTVQGFPVKGDNATAELDKFSLPLPSNVNIGRRLFIYISICDQDGKGGMYEITLLLKQGNNELTLSTTEKSISGSYARELFAVEFIKEGN